MKKINYSIVMAMIYILFGTIIGLTSYYLGHVYMGYKRYDLYSRFFYFEVLGGILVGFINYVFFKMIVNRFVKRLTNLLNRVQHGDYSVRLGLEAHDVIGKFSNALDSTISTLQETDQRLYKDHLTCLENRLGLVRHFELQFIDHPELKHYLIYFDIDKFKSINDTHGHIVGDEVLKSFSERLKKLLLIHEKAFRISGDEFTVAISIGHEESINIYVSKLASLIENPFKTSVGDIYISISIGVSCYRCQMTLDDLMNEADEAMYQEKQIKKQNHTMNPMSKNKNNNVSAFKGAYREHR